MSLFTKKKAPRRQFRKKVVHSLDEEDEEQKNEPVEASTTNPPPTAVPQSLLSFDNDMGDTAEFKLKKKDHSKRIAREAERRKRREEQEKEVVIVESSDEEENAVSAISHRLTAGVIPDPMLIHAARKQRELARKTGDTIPLDSMPVKGNSRLIREGESDDSDGEGRGRFMDRQEASKQMQVLAAMEEAGSGSDEEKFVEEQIYKAVKGIVVSDTHSVQGPGPNGTPLPPPLPTPAPVIPETLVPITVETLKSRLSAQLSDLRSLNSQHKNRIETMNSDIVTADNEIGVLEDHISDLSLEYQFYQETHGYIRDLLSCLTEKVSMIDELERSMHAVLAGVAETIIERRRQDVRDMAAECSQTTPTDHTHKQRVVERDGRARRRREARRERGVVAHHDGLSSDDEQLETNRVKTKNEIDAILGKREAVFSDVKSSFSDLSIIKSQLEQWKHSFPKSYNQAYISLCLPKLFSPYARLELLSWNPLSSRPGVIEECKWFNTLMFYGFLEGIEPDRDDPDMLLIPSIIEKAVLPKLAAIIKSVWDPLSGSQTRKLVSLVRSLLEDYPTLCTTKGGGLGVVNAVTMKLRGAIDSDVFIPLFAAKQLENPTSAKALFHHRQYWSCIKLVENITQWEGIVSTDALQDMVLDGLLSRYLLLSLQNSPITHGCVVKVQQLVALIPAAWYSDGAMVTRPLAGLVRYILHLGECLDRAAAGQSDVEKASTRSSLQLLVECLTTLRANKEATEMTQQYHIKVK